MQYRLYIDREYTNNPSINPIDKHRLCSEMIKFQHVAKARPPNILETVELVSILTRILRRLFKFINRVTDKFPRSTRHLPPIRIVNLHIRGFVGSNQV